MNQRTPDFRQLQPNFTIQVAVISYHANNNNNNNLAGDDERTVPTRPVGTPGVAASDPGHQNDGHEQHEQPDDGEHHQLPATLQLALAQGWKFSARTSRSQRTWISLFKGEYKKTIPFSGCCFVKLTNFSIHIIFPDNRSDGQDHSPVDSPHSLSPPAPQHVVMRQSLAHLQVTFGQSWEENLTTIAPQPSHHLGGSPHKEPTYSVTPLTTMSVPGFPPPMGTFTTVSGISLIPWFSRWALAFNAFLTTFFCRPPAKFRTSFLRWVTTTYAWPTPQYSSGSRY